MAQEEQFNGYLHNSNPNAPANTNCTAQLIEYFGQLGTERAGAAIRVRRCVGIGIMEIAIELLFLVAIRPTRGQLGLGFQTWWLAWRKLAPTCRAPFKVILNYPIQF